METFPATRGERRERNRRKRRRMGVSGRSVFVLLDMSGRCGAEARQVLASNHRCSRRAGEAPVTRGG